jgi:site-specific recombinase XerD
MDKQEVLKKFIKQLIIENYSEQTIRNYTSALKLFFGVYKKLETTQIYIHISSYSINKIKSPADKLETVI